MDKTRVLIVEDDAEISRLMAMYLEAEGLHTKVIDDGLAAISAIKHYIPNLIILDLLLPGLSGIEICKQARTFYYGPILILTACDYVNKVNFLELGADDILIKPIKPQVLLARIEGLIRKVVFQQ